MMSRMRVAAIVMMVAMLSGCVTPKSYVDPSLSKASYSDLLPVDKNLQNVGPSPDLGPMELTDRLFTSQWRSQSHYEVAPN